ncbi:MULTISPECIES: AAA family ATPase [unclassified Roseovarius]|uniref:AAA family ATPase n=1 Tax=unclassified Roseovarius TaxID=2614913 RepID=UPI00273F91B8|nr:MULTISPECIES: AAA family ATPase [unclassified Roseovarius]
MADKILEKVNDIVNDGARNLVDRRVIFELAVLGVLAKEHVLMIGPPGTGKSAAVRAVAQRFSGRHFEYLLGRFTEPAELFGALSIEALRDGRVEVVTEGMLPEANVAFLDEIFLGSTAILNTLLGLLNERVYRRGAQQIDVPLWTCFAASNAMPDDPMLAAFADRFLMTTFVDPVGLDNVASLLRSGWSLTQAVAPSDPGQVLTEAEVRDLVQRVHEVDLDQIIDPFSQIVGKLSVRGISFSDRRIVRGQKLIAAAAVLAGRQQATLADLWPVVFMVQDRSLQEQAKEILAEELQLAENPVLDQAAKTAAYGPAAYAADLAKSAQEHLDNKPQLRDDPSFEPWCIRAESMIARIDAGFAEEMRPETLALARSALVAAIR